MADSIDCRIAPQANEKQSINILNKGSSWNKNIAKHLWVFILEYKHTFVVGIKYPEEARGSPILLPGAWGEMMSFAARDLVRILFCCCEDFLIGVMATT